MVIAATLVATAVTLITNFFENQRVCLMVHNLKGKSTVVNWIGEIRIQ